MQWATAPFFCRRSPYIKRFSEYGGAKVLNARIFLFYRRCTADFCFVPPYEKNQKVEGNIKRFLRIHSVFAEHRCYLGEPADSLPCRGDDRPTGNDGQTGRIRFLADDKLRQMQTTQRWKNMFVYLCQIRLIRWRLHAAQHLVLHPMHHPFPQGNPALCGRIGQRPRK